MLSWLAKMKMLLVFCASAAYIRGERARSRVPCGESVRQGRERCFMGKKPFLWTVVETPAFVNSSKNIWSDEDREHLIGVMAEVVPDGDDLIPGSAGCYKSRKSVGNYGKSSGARVIYWVDTEGQRIFLLTAYTKSNTSTIPGSDLAHVVGRLRKYLR